MADIIDLKPKQEQEKLAPQPKTTSEIVGILDNYINQIEESCFQALTMLPEKLEQELWNEEQMGIYKYVVDQLAASQILIDYKKRLEK